MSLFAARSENWIVCAVRFRERVDLREKLRGVARAFRDRIFLY